MLRPFVFFTCLTFVRCLTQTEIDTFGTSGNFPEAYVTVESSHTDRYIIKSSGIPDHATQVVNPNTATNQNYNISIPKIPEENTGLHGCLPLGMIGITRTGVSIYNPLTGDLLNAVEGSAQETFDSCDGHTSPGGAYHYHKIPDSCLYKGEQDEFIGVALDGYSIYGPDVSDLDRRITSSDLDECHGRTVNGTYRYHATTTWPYFIGCFKGKVMQNLMNLAYTCNISSDSGWEGQWTYYMCHCPSGGNGPGGMGPGGMGPGGMGPGGMGPGGGMSPPPDRCDPSNPQRPLNCPVNTGNKAPIMKSMYLSIVVPMFATVLISKLRCVLFE